jgi:SDR family mycofactocin-dependent oxidoreductase
MQELAGQVAFITGGARGQGRSHAITLAGAGADIVLVDNLEDDASVPVPMATQADMEETRRLVEDQDRRCLTIKADVRDVDQMIAAADQAIAEFGKIDILLANAGIMSYGTISEMTAEMWQGTIDVNLTGVFNAFRAVLPHMIEAGYGRVVATASGGAKIGFSNIGHYCASKWGVVGLVKSAAMEVAQHGITVNAVCPTNVNSDMIRNEYVERLFLPGVENPTEEQIEKAFIINPMGVPWIEPSDVSHIIRFIVNPATRYTTGETFGPLAGSGATNGAI